jgi:hypothetical protein
VSYYGNGCRFNPLEASSNYNLTQFGEFYVVGILSIWVVEKNNMIELKE